MSDRIEYGARGSDRLVSLPAVSGAAFGPGADKLSVITVGPQPALVILGRSANGTLEAQWSLPCYNCRLVRSQNEDATVAYSDFWLFRISAGNRFSSADAPWPEIEAVFWHKRLTSVAPEEASDMRKLRVNGSEVIEFGENALRQGGYSVGWQSILTPPWKTTRTLNYECGTAGSESPTRPIEALCDWEHRSKGSHPTGTEAVFAGLSAEPAPVTQASMTPFVATGRRGDRR
jgi:hypothetical protein